LLFPSASSRSTSSSRSDSGTTSGCGRASGAVSGSWANRATTFAATDGCSTDSPRAAACTASTNRADDTSLSR
jgi:hypothetical protein